MILHRLEYSSSLLVTLLKGFLAGLVGPIYTKDFVPVEYHCEWAVKKEF